MTGAGITDYLVRGAAMIGPLVIAITFHEVAHGRVALLRGDTTARDLGRLSLNPIRHVDLFGTIILPLMLALAGAPVFGWAKPVPVVRSRLRRPLADMSLVAVAGPATNIVLALFSAILLMLVQPAADSFIGIALFSSLLVNIFLALFNLLPIPPFDGSRIIRPLIPGEAGRKWDGLDRAGMGILILLLVIIPWMVPAFDPLRWLLLPAAGWTVETMLHIAALMTGQSAG